MKKLFLTSSIHAVAQDIAKRVDLSKGNKLVFIDTASEAEEGDKQWLEDDKQALIDVGFQVKSYTITGKNLSQLSTDLSGYDYLYLSGGNSHYLLKQSLQSGFFNLVKNLVEKEGKTYIGTSAGSVIAGIICPNFSSDENGSLPLEHKAGYGFVNFTVMPHWGSELFRKEYFERKLEIAYRDDQVPLLLLTDNQYAMIEGESLEIVSLKDGGSSQ